MGNGYLKEVVTTYTSLREFLEAGEKRVSDTDKRQVIPLWHLTNMYVLPDNSNRQQLKKAITEQWDEWQDPRKGSFVEYQVPGMVEKAKEGVPRSVLTLFIQEALPKIIAFEGYVFRLKAGFDRFIDQSRHQAEIFEPEEVESPAAIVTDEETAPLLAQIGQLNEQILLLRRVISQREEALQRQRNDAGVRIEELLQKAQELEARLVDEKRELEESLTNEINRRETAEGEVSRLTQELEAAQELIQSLGTQLTAAHESLEDTTVVINLRKQVELLLSQKEELNRLLSAETRLRLSLKRENEGLNLTLEASERANQELNILLAAAQRKVDSKTREKNNKPANGTYRWWAAGVQDDDEDRIMEKIMSGIPKELIAKDEHISVNQIQILWLKCLNALAKN